MRVLRCGIAVLVCILLGAPPAGAAGLGTIEVGVLRFGTVSWELDVIKHHALDEKEGFTLEVRPFASNDAADVALMAEDVDAIVEDWIWVSRQRASGAAVTFIPYSSSIGALMVPRGGGITDLAGLRGKKIGVAGGPLDKSWLLLQAYAEREAGIDLARDAEPVFASPPLVTEKLKGGEFDAALNYWHFSARLEAEGFERLIGISEVQEALGVPASTPQLGYVFQEPWVEAHRGLVEAFARASAAAKALMRGDAEWQRLRSVTRAASDPVLDAYMRRYREGIPERWGEKERADAARLYAVLAELGGEKLVGGGDRLAPGTFWAGITF